MRHSHRSIGHRAGPAFIAVTLGVSFMLAFDPSFVPATLGVDATLAPSTDPGQSIDPGSSPTLDPGTLPSPSVDIAPSAPPADSPGPTATPGDSPAPSDQPTASPDPVAGQTPPASPGPTDTPTPTPSPTPSEAPTSVKVAITQASSALSAGGVRVDPGAEMPIQLSVTPDADMDGGRLIETLPGGWTPSDIDGGTFDPATNSIAWDLPSVASGTTLAHRIVVVAPSLAAGGSLIQPAAFLCRLLQGGGTARAADLDVVVAPAVVISHRTLSQVGGPSDAATFLPLDAAVSNEQRFEVFRIRFQVENPDLLPVAWTPQLEFARAGTATYTVVPAGEPVVGVPFYVSPEWRDYPRSADGTVSQEGSEQIPAAQIAGVPGDPVATPVTGRRWMGVNPAPLTSLAGREWTVVEFSVRATVDAPYLSSWSFRVTNAGTPLVGAVQARVSLGNQPPVELSPGQRVGRPADSTAAKPAASAARSVLPLLAFALPPARLTAAGGADPHGLMTGTGDACGVCHRAHSAQNVNLLPNAGPQANTCFLCHNGSGANANVQAAYSAVPSPDVPASREYYRHDALSPSTHTVSTDNEFQDAAGNPILNRHSECADCHDPHKAIASLSTPTSSGWTAAGAQADISGVSLVNGAAGSAPTYTFQASITFEYQLCLKCHSGFTSLLSNAGKPPSQYELDKGIEFNPANTSYHPVEKAGTNATSAMNLNLSGSSPYKQWIFTSASTVRCVNCHGDPTKYNADSPPDAGSDLAPHASANRGILMLPYQDRVLTSSLDTYNASRFALCYLCHSEAPFADTSGNNRSDTNFRLHGMHLNQIGGEGAGGTNIDTPGAGESVALCAECHFRIHSTAFTVGSQGATSRLVNFAPDVTAVGTLNPLGPNAWSVGGASCTLTCHGFDHVGLHY